MLPAVYTERSLFLSFLFGAILATADELCSSVSDSGGMWRMLSSDSLTFCIHYEEAKHALVFCAREEEIDADNIDAAATGVCDKDLPCSCLAAIAARSESASASLIGGRTTNVW